MKSKTEETKKQEEPKVPVAPIPGSDIVQPDPNAKDSQGYIRENAKKGESMPVPNTVGYNPIEAPLGEEK